MTRIYSLYRAKCLLCSHVTDPSSVITRVIQEIFIHLNHHHPNAEGPIFSIEAIEAH